MIYLGLKDEQLTAIHNGGFRDSDLYSLVFSDDGVDVVVNFKTFGQLKKFLKMLQDIQKINVELDHIKSFIDPYKRKDE